MAAGDGTVPADDFLPHGDGITGRRLIWLVNHHFLNCWRELDGLGSENRGLLSLMRWNRHNLRHDELDRLRTYLAQYPALEVMYRFNQRFCYFAAEEASHPPTVPGFDSTTAAGHL